MMSNLQGVLLRFREDLVGGQGDMTKMFYMVRVDKEEEMMQLFVWQYKGEDKLRTFGMTRLVMGNKPSSNISIVAVKETARLEDFQTRFPVAFQALTYDSYVDNVFLTAPDIPTLTAGIQEIENVSAKGSFMFKEWIISGQNIPEQSVSVSLPNAIDLEVEKALGVFWDVQKDEFYIKLGLSEDEKRMAGIFVDAKVPIGNDSSGVDTEGDPIETAFDTNETDVDSNEAGSKLREIKPKLTLRICLSFHAKTHDPLGLVLPTRMIGNLLFRKSLQKVKKEQKGKIPWDEELPDALKLDWLEYFGMLAQLETVRFSRSVKPENSDPNVDPLLVTFTDGNPDSYALWPILCGLCWISLRWLHSSCPRPSLPTY